MGSTLAERRTSIVPASEVWAGADGGAVVGSITSGAPPSLGRGRKRMILARSFDTEGPQTSMHTLASPFAVALASTSLWKDSH